MVLVTPKEVRFNDSTKAVFDRQLKWDIDFAGVPSYGRGWTVFDRSPP